MDNTFTCTVKEAKKLLKHMDDNDKITMIIFNNKTFIHNQPERIKKKNGEELIDKADSIEYQDNEIFGRLSLHGVVKEKDIIHNLLFPQFPKLE